MRTIAALIAAGAQGTNDAKTKSASRLSRQFTRCMSQFSLREGAVIHVKRFAFI